MEFIRGLPLDEYARRHGLDLAARLDLLARVCDAVQHAHDQGVIHRDLKPANILVDETGQPKVLDFGVARATDADLLTAAGLTQTGQLLGTPSYMSPEQVAADPAALDRRSDVYALGVILFELLAHRLPYQLEHRPLAEAARLILEQDPPRLGSLDPELPRRRGDDRGQGAGEGPGAALRRRRRTWRRTSGAGWPTSRSWRGRRRRCTSCASSPGGTRAWWAGWSPPAVALVLGLVGTILFAVGEARQRGQAEQNARQAIDESARRSSRPTAPGWPPRSRRCQNHDVADAARQLDAAPEALRGWEWRHLHSRLDDSSAVIPLPAGGAGFLLPAPDRLRVGVLTGAGLRLTDLEGGEPRTLPIGPERGQLGHRHADPPRPSGRGVGREHDLRPARRGRPGPLSRGHAGGRRRPVPSS